MTKDLHSMSTERLVDIYKSMYARDADDEPLMWLLPEEKQIMGEIEDIVTARTGTDPLSWNGTEEERSQSWHRH